jgi:hypothetical protein
MDFHSAPVNQLSAKIYQALLSLNRRSKGKMRAVLQQCRHGNINITNGEVAYYSHYGMILAWTLLFSIDGQRIQYIYVRKASRSKGMGTALALYAKRKYPNIKAHVIDSSIFERVGIKVADNVYLDYIPD